MFARICLTAVLFALVASAHAQSKPDFSGEWAMNREACTLSPAAAAIQSGTVHIEHRDPAFHYKAELVSPAGAVRYEFELQSDGRETPTTVQGITTASALRWDGAGLAITSHMQRPNGTMNISFRFELLDGGRRLRSVEQIRGAGRDQDNTWIFDRR